MKSTLKDLAALLGGSLKGDPAKVVTGAAGLGEAGPEDVSFLADPKHARDADSTKAGCLLVAAGFSGCYSGPTIEVADAHLAFARWLGELERERRPLPQGIDSRAFVHPSAKLGPGVAVGAFTVVEEGATIGEGSVLYPQVYVGAHAVLGKGCLLYPQAVVRERCELGERVIVHPGAVIGADGYGFIQQGGVHRKIPQVGKVVIEDDVELGANVCIDRATVGETRIGAGTKMDNLVQVGHNCSLGRGCLIVSQVGIAGSCTIGDNVVMAGQAGVKDHLRIGSKVMVLGQAGVMSDLEDGAVVWGTPARPAKQTFRLQALVARLPELFDEVKAMRKKAEGGGS